MVSAPVTDTSARVEHAWPVELYSSILKLAPLMLLKLLAMGAFGPSAQGDRRGGRVALVGDVTLVVSVVVGGFVAALVLGDVLPPTATTRWAVVLAGCLSLLLLAAHMLGEIASMYKARPRAHGLAAPSGKASASPERSA